MKKWHFPILFVTIVTAVAIGMNFGTLYDSAMFAMTGDCKYWHANRSGDFMDEEERGGMSTREIACSLRKYTEEMRRQNNAF